MSLSFSQTPGNGVTLSFPITLEGGYISSDDIVVEFITISDGSVEVQPSSTYEITSAGNVVFDTAPPVTVEVRIRRSVSNDSTFSTFTRGSVFGQTNLNNSFLWALYQLQQLADGFLPDDHYWKSSVNAGGNKLTNVAQGDSDGDVVTYDQLAPLMEDYADLESVAAAAAASANDAAASAESIGDAEDVCTAKAIEAAASADSVSEAVNSVALNTIHRNTTTGNPHGVTKADVSLGNVPNLDTTSAVNKTNLISVTGAVNLDTLVTLLSSVNRYVADLNLIRNSYFSRTGTYDFTIPSYSATFYALTWDVNRVGVGLVDSNQAFQAPFAGTWRIGFSVRFYGLPDAAQHLVVEIATNSGSGITSVVQHVSDSGSGANGERTASLSHLIHLVANEVVYVRVAQSGGTTGTIIRVASSIFNGECIQLG